jgi:hypothetical protein
MAKKSTNQETGIRLYKGEVEVQDAEGNTSTEIGWILQDSNGARVAKEFTFKGTQQLRLPIPNDANRQFVSVKHFDTIISENNLSEEEGIELSVKTGAPRTQGPKQLIDKKLHKFMTEDELQDYSEILDMVTEAFKADKPTKETTNKTIVKLVEKYGKEQVRALINGEITLEDLKEEGK